VDFLVLDAADRVGGRALTDHGLAGGHPLELGALMVHGRRAATHSWIRELGLDARRLPVLQRALFAREGRIASFPAMALPFHPAFGLGAVYQGAVGIPKALRRYRGPDLSLAAFLDRVGAKPAAREMVTLLASHAAAADPDEIGVLGPAEEASLAAEEFGYANFQVLQGYSALAQRRSSPFAGRLRLNTRVTRVSYSPSGVTLEALGGGQWTHSFTGERAVVTLPLGVLKGRDVEFDPPLPPEKRRAIDLLGFGNALLVHLRLGVGNLRRRLGDFALLWGEGPSTFHRPYVGIQDRPQIVTAFTVGREALARSRLSAEEVVEVTMAELEGVLPPGVDPGTPEAYLVKAWPADPFSRGGYSFLPPGTGVAERRALAAPVDGVLFFAGEATHTGGESSTVHGAIETGYRAAEEVLRGLGRT
jgi:monoamine oxidase